MKKAFAILFVVVILAGIAGDVRGQLTLRTDASGRISGPPGATWEDFVEQNFGLGDAGLNIGSLQVQNSIYAWSGVSTDGTFSGSTLEVNDAYMGYAEIYRTDGIPMLITNSGADGSTIAAFSDGAAYPGLRIVSTFNGIQLNFYKTDTGTLYGRMGFVDGTAGFTFQDKITTLGGIQSEGNITVGSHADLNLSGPIKSYADRNITLIPQSGYLIEAQATLDMGGNTITNIGSLNLGGNDITNVGNLGVNGLFAAQVNSNTFTSPDGFGQFSLSTDGSTGRFSFDLQGYSPAPVYYENGALYLTEQLNTTYVSAGGVFIDGNTQNITGLSEIDAGQISPVSGSLSINAEVTMSAGGSIHTDSGTIYAQYGSFSAGADFNGDFVYANNGVQVPQGQSVQWSGEGITTPSRMYVDAGVGYPAFRFQVPDINAFSEVVIDGESVTAPRGWFGGISASDGGFAADADGVQITTAAANPGPGIYADRVHLFLEETSPGSGKYKLMCQFPTGAAQVVATEP